MSTDHLTRPRAATRIGISVHYDPEAFGRFSEAIARLLGTARYLVGQTVLVLIWIALNVSAFRWRWDPYPFILLNLMFSTQASYAAPLILLAQNRQAERDRQQAESGPGGVRPHPQRCRVPRSGTGCGASRGRGPAHGAGFRTRDRATDQRDRGTTGPARRPRADGELIQLLQQ